MGARDKLREFFLANIGKILNSGDLRAVANISEWARRVRELRNDEGFDILTHNDRADLMPGEYVLISAKPKPVISSTISKELRAYILDRNGFTCQSCGAEAGKPNPDDAERNTRLHISHIVDKSKGGSDDRSNLRALCSFCNEGAQNLTLDTPTWVTLVSQLRRAKLDDQKQALAWLKRKFGN